MCACLCCIFSGKQLFRLHDIERIGREGGLKAAQQSLVEAQRSYGGKFEHLEEDMNSERGVIYAMMVC